MQEYVLTVYITSHDVSNVHFGMYQLFSIWIYLKMQSYSFDSKAEFQQLLLWSHVSYDPSEIIIICF